MTQSRNWSLYTKIGSKYFNFNYLDQHIDPQPDANGCLNWTGATHRQGYGMMGGINEDNKRFMTVVHRVVMMRHLNRELTHDDFVIKTCSNHKCCNPAHYIIGDYSKKSEIMFKNNRWRPGKKADAPPKKQNRAYKWSEEEIKFLRTASLDDIQDQFGVERLRASRMRHGARNSFKWLKD